MKHKRISVVVLVGLLFILSGAMIAVPALSRPEAALPEGKVALSDEVYVPGGEYIRGCAVDIVGNLGCSIESAPLGAIYVDAFYIDKTEVTNSQYAACVAAGACEEPMSVSSQTHVDYYNVPDFANYPVIHVDYPRADAYCRWVGKRLPTEGEWEKAARGTDRRWFPWGNEMPTCERANIYGCLGDTAQVGSYPDSASPYGALDMSGNVREWVSDLYDKFYFIKAPYYNPQGPAWTVTMEHLVRGGSWNDIYTHLHTWGRLDEHDIYETHLIGFRCLRPATGPTPVPTPTPSPTPTPIPSDAGLIGPEGGMLWLSQPEQITLLHVPAGSQPAEVEYVLTGTGARHAGELRGSDQFFTIEGLRATEPVTLMLGFRTTTGLIPGTVDLYRLDGSAWVTSNITVTERGPEHIVAWVTHPGLYGVMGQTNLTYLPALLREQ